MQVANPSVEATHKNLRFLRSPHVQRYAHPQLKLELEMENVFSDILGREYEQLPQAVKYFHEIPKATFVGSAKVRGSTSLIANLIRKVFSFPVPSELTPVIINVERTAYIDKWNRDFAGRKFSSSFVKKAKGSLLSESFGPFKFYFSLSVSKNKMNWNFEKWALWVIPLPKVLGPKITS